MEETRLTSYERAVIKAHEDMRANPVGSADTEQRRLCEDSLKAYFAMIKRKRKEGVLEPDQ